MTVLYWSLAIFAPVFAYRDYRTVSIFALGNSFGKQLFPTGFAIVQTLLILGRCCCESVVFLPCMGSVPTPCCAPRDSPHVCTAVGAQDSGKTTLAFWGVGRKEGGFVAFLLATCNLTPSLLSCCLEIRVGESGWVVILPSNYLPSFGNMLYAPPSQSRAVLTQMLSEAALELLSTSVGGFCCFSLNIYIGATHWNIQMYTQRTPKQEETASPTSFISLFSCCSREKPKYMSGRGPHLNHRNRGMRFFHY